MSDPTASKTFLRQQFDVLLGAYKWPEKPGQFAAWETWLSTFPRWAVGKVIMGAPDRWPDEFPEVGPLRSAIAEVIRNKRREDDTATKPEPRAEEEYHGVPEFLELAERWEREDREKPSRDGVSRGPVRAAELNALWARKSKLGNLDGDPVDLPQPPQGDHRSK